MEFVGVQAISTNDLNNDDENENMWIPNPMKYEHLEYKD